MHFIEMIQEAGWPGYLVIALGGLGLALGFFAIVALLSKSPSAFTMGVATLLVGAAAAGAGIGGTFWGRSQVERAVGYVNSGLDKERIMRQGYKEAQSASWLGLFAALVPLALGGAAAVGGSRVKRPKTQVQHLMDPMASSADEGAGQSVAAIVFVGITALACGGAWVVAHSALPKLSYDFDDQDSDAWSLASVLEEAKKERTEKTCESLAEAVTRYWEASDLREWPRTFRKPIPPALSGWRAEADRCMTRALEQLEAGEGGWTQDSILESSLLQDDALHARALTFATKVPAAAADDQGPRVGMGNVPREAIAQAVRAAKNQVRFCYERELQKTPTLEGKVTVEFVIGTNGQVSSAKDASAAPFPSAKVTECLLGVVRKLKFPRPVGGGVVTVRYPFVFESSGG